MSYHVQTYLTNAADIRRVFGSKDIALYEKLADAFAAQFDEQNDYFSRDLPENVTYQSLLIDIIYGELRFPDLAFVYGYIYEMLCGYYGELIYAPGGEFLTDYFWAIRRTPKAFIPIPFSPDFPDIYSIERANLEAEKERFLALDRIDGAASEQIEAKRNDFRFIFDKAIAEDKDLVFFAY